MPEARYTNQCNYSTRGAERAAPALVSRPSLELLLRSMFSRSARRADPTGCRPCAKGACKLPAGGRDAPPSASVSKPVVSSSIRPRSAARSIPSGFPLASRPRLLCAGCGTWCWDFLHRTPNPVTLKFVEHADSYSLSLGERVRVRDRLALVSRPRLI
jgi:hypothetical protein